MPQIYYRPSTCIKRGPDVHRLHARRLFYGNPRFDVVHVRSDDLENPWLARILGMFRVHVHVQPGILHEGWISLALVQWLERDAEDHVQGIPTYRYSQEFPQPCAVELDTIEAPVRLVTSPRQPPDEPPRFCLLPYGKTAKAHGL